MIISITKIAIAAIIILSVMATVQPAFNNLTTALNSVATVSVIQK